MEIVNSRDHLCTKHVIVNLQRQVEDSSFRSKGSPKEPTCDESVGYLAVTVKLAVVAFTFPSFIFNARTRRDSSSCVAGRTAGVGAALHVLMAILRLIKKIQAVLKLNVFKEILTGSRNAAMSQVNLRFHDYIIIKFHNNS